MKFNLLYFLFAASLFLSACGEKPLFEKTLDLPNQTWRYIDTLHFDFEVTDTTKVYDLVFVIEHQNTFKTQNFYTNIYTRYPDGKEEKQQVSLELYDDTGESLGKCGSEKCRVEAVTPTYFNQIGKYRISIEQYSRTDTLQGIEKIGLQLIDKGLMGKEKEGK